MKRVADDKHVAQKRKRSRRASRSVDAGSGGVPESSNAHGGNRSVRSGDLLDFWSTTNPKLPWVLHEKVQSDLCKSDIMFRLLFATPDSESEHCNKHDTLYSHIDGLVSGLDDATPGIIVASQTQGTWSQDMLETLSMLKHLNSHEVIGGPLYTAFRRMIYHAVIFVSLPHIVSFAQYIAKHSMYPERICHFIEHVLIPSERVFFYEGSTELNSLDLWVSFLRNRWFLYVSGSSS
jgi:hypothetical protein